MFNLPIKTFKIKTLTIIFIFCNLASAEHFTVDMADNHRYKSLINRTDSIKVFYSTNNKNFSCKVEVTLDNMKWVSSEKKISKELLYNDPLSNCLSQERAKQILSQTFLEFGQGL
jgi:hypothetical protein